MISQWSQCLNTVFNDIQKEYVNIDTHRGPIESKIATCPIGQVGFSATCPKHIFSKIYLSGTGGQWVMCRPDCSSFH